MNNIQFKESLAQSSPPGSLSVIQTALWYDGKGNWEKAHDLINDLADPVSAHIHAYLHRKEGDTGNACYWYQRAGKPVPQQSLQQEWEELVELYL